MTAVHDEIQSRLGKLRADYERGRLQLQELTQQETVLRDALLRISGVDVGSQRTGLGGLGRRRHRQTAGCPVPFFTFPSLRGCARR